jgi:fibronectin type III domain protein
MNPQRWLSGMLRLILTSVVVGCSSSGPAPEGTSGAVESRAVPGMQQLTQPPLLQRFRPAFLGPPPTNITAYMTPTAASLRWSPLPDVLGYIIQRAPTPTGQYGPVTTAPIKETSFTDAGLAPNTSYAWIVSAIYSDGREGPSAPATFTTPAAVNPSNFTATAEIGGAVTLRWNPVPWAASYWVQGPGVQGPSGQPAREVSATETKHAVNFAKNLPGGTYTYSIIANYRGTAGTFADEANPARASVTLKGLPPHPPWLARKDPYAGQWPPEDPGRRGLPVSYSKASEYISANASFASGATSGSNVLAMWKTANGFDSPEGVIRAVYYNAGDLNLGRNMRCKRVGQKVACYVGNHGPFPRSPDFPDVERALAAAISGNESLAYVAENLGYVAMEVSLDKPDEVKFYSFSNPTVLSTYAFLDSEKTSISDGVHSPFNCLACHGGRYDPPTKTVKGASFLPFDVFSFKYSQQPGFTQADQEEAFRQLNALVKSTKPNATHPDNPIVTFIDGMYGGRVEVPGTKANNTWVPSGWSTAPNVYNAVVKQFCRTCHMAMGGDLTFSTYQKFRSPAYNPNTGRYLGGLKDRIQMAICNGSMPHAEVPFRKFWQNPNISWLGYMEDPSVVGIKCPPP